MFLSYLLALLIFLPMNAIHAQEPHHTTAYIGQAGEIDALLTYSTYFTDHCWNSNGKKLPTHNHFFQSSYLLFAEVALNPSNSFTFNGGYSAVEESLNGNSRGIQDIECGWKHLLHATDLSSLTTQLIGIIPIGDTKTSIRYAQPGVELDVLYSSTSFIYQHQTWCDLGIGYRYYQGFPSDLIWAQSAVGYEIYPRFCTIVSAQLDYGLFNGESKMHFNNVVFNSNYRLMTLQLEFLINIFSHGSISLGGFWHAWGQNIGTGGGYFGGTWINF